MKVCCFCREAKPPEAYYKHSRNKDGLQSRCKDCCREHYNNWVANNPTRRKQLYRSWYAANKSRERNRAVVWAKENRARKLAHNAEYRLTKIQRVPAWANQDAIRTIYEECTRRRLEGEDVSVDHYYPLRGEIVCGLHVENNLRIISALENSSKGNKMPEEDNFTVDMLTRDTIELPTC